MPALRSIFTFLLVGLLSSLIYVPAYAQTKTSDQIRYEITDITQVNHSTTIAKAKLVTSVSKPYHINADNLMITDVSIIMTVEGENQLDIKFIDNKNNRFEMPETYPFPPNTRPPKEPLKHPKLFDVEWENKTAGFRVVRNDKDRDTILDITPASFVYSDKYLEFTVKRTSLKLYGLGERYFRFDLTEGTYTMWARDNFLAVEDGTFPGDNTYSQWPVYLQREIKGGYHMCYIRSMNAMDAVVAQQTITFKIVGGIIHLKLFIGDKYPETSLKPWHAYIGGWLLPPFWMFGFQQSRWGYNSIEKKLEVARNYRTANIPLEVLWNDVDYNLDRVPLTVDPISVNTPALKKMLAEYDLKFIINTTPVIPLRNFKVVEWAKKYDIPIKNAEGDYLLGNGWAVGQWYPDFSHPNISKFWEHVLDSLYEYLPYNALWVDMDEFSNFCYGECRENVYTRDISYTEEKKRPDKNGLPYLPGDINLEFFGLSLNATHANGITEFYMHGTNGMMITNITNQYLRKKFKTKYPYVLTRSSFPGTNKVGFKWSGDQNGFPREFQLSLASMFNFQIFGMPFYGIDIMGFAWGEQVDATMMPWMKEGVFYPFARQHAHSNAIPKEFYVFGENFTKTASDHVRLRYSMLKFYFSLFVRNNHTGTIFRPPFFEFPDDNVLYDYNIMHSEFMLGKELLFIVSKFWEMYLPEETTWYDFYKGDVVATKGGKQSTSREHYKEMIRLYLREGHIVHLQDASTVNNSKGLDNKFELRAGLDGNLEARGQIMTIGNYSDEEEVEMCDGSNNCMLNLYVHADVSGSPVITFRGFANSTKENPFYITPNGARISNLTLYGVPVTTQVQRRLLNGQDKLCLYDKIDKTFIPISYNFALTGDLQIGRLQLILPNISLDNPMEYVVFSCQAISCGVLKTDLTADHIKALKTNTMYLTNKVNYSAIDFTIPNASRQNLEGYCNSSYTVSASLKLVPTLFNYAMLIVAIIFSVGMLS